MELSPQKVRSMSFSTTKKGYERTEVDTFVTEVATALETAQNETTAMEARARAAIARLKEISAQQAEAPAESDAPEAPSEPTVSVDEQETISRTLLLAQRTADATVADATARAESMVAEATAEAEQTLAQAREEADRIVAEARVEGRNALDDERRAAESEVNELRGRRDVLETDVQHLEEFLIAQRDRIRAATVELTTIIERVPDGLGNMRRPLLSSSEDTEIDASGDTDADVGDRGASDVPPYGADVSSDPGNDQAVAWRGGPPDGDDVNEATAGSNPTAASADDPTVEIDVAELHAAAEHTDDESANSVGTVSAAPPDDPVDAADGTPAETDVPRFEFGLAHDEPSPTERSS